MPKYFANKVFGYYLYFTAKCIVEAMHVHASDSKLTEDGSAKFFVMADGSTRVMRQGMLSDRDVHKLQEFIKENYREMYRLWSSVSDEGFYLG